MGGYIERISNEIADIFLREGINYTQTKAVFRAVRTKAGLHAPKEDLSYGLTISSVGPSPNPQLNSY